MNKTDMLYVEKRNTLIPEADRIANARYQEMKKEYKGRIEKMPTSLGREFSLAMTELAIREGLVNKGMLDIFHAESLPKRFIK